MAAKTKSKVSLPAGFKAIEHLGSFWKGEKPGDTVSGKLISSKVKHFPKQGKYAARDANVYTLQLASGKKLEVTQSGGLGALEEVKKGQTVCIVFMGMKAIKGRSAMREYMVGVK